MTKKAFQSFAVDNPDGSGQIVVNEDHLYADDHPFVKQWPNMFGELADMIDVRPSPAKRSKVEQATAAPGEIRITTK